KVDPLKVAGLPHPQPRRSGQPGVQQPVAGPVLEQRRPVQRRHRVGVARVPFPRRPLRAHPPRSFRVTLLAHPVPLPQTILPPPSPAPRATRPHRGPPTESRRARRPPSPPPPQLLPPVTRPHGVQPPPPPPQLMPVRRQPRAHSPPALSRLTGHGSPVRHSPG